MFIGRANELSQMQSLYDTNGFQCMIIWGRRRVGKTTLINEFVKDKPTIYFMATESTAKDNLESFSQSIAEFHGISQDIAPNYSSFEQALNAIYEISKKQRLILVIDEYPYLAKAYKPISSLLQKLIDLQFKKDSQLYIILCGSSMSFMEKQVLGYQSPLYGRRTGQLQINPFDFYEYKNYYQNFSPEELAIVYGITGGIPQYMFFFNDQLSLQENIIKNFLTPSGYLFEEPSNLLKQELREPTVYNSIIKAVATGSSKSSEITSKVGLESASKLALYMDKLLELGIIEKETPLGEKAGKKTIYSVKDGMFNFWYRFIPTNLLLIQRNMGRLAWENIEPLIGNYMGKTFEKICIDYLWHNYANLPMHFQQIGRWWGTNPKLKRQEEIDIVAVNDNSAIVAECKWRNEKTNENVLFTLLERATLLSYPQKHYYIFSKSGFSDKCKQAAKINNVHLITYQDMLK